ncbi:MAG: EscU/YscU/HrcU family type III secretion system export apparatus switch protein [Alphaproteobacteria bacterium]|nr:EscU/YscU/HrcU family type III secretion system export apparatus switch protein [Alphaproteobacteria bacterium]
MSQEPQDRRMVAIALEHNPELKSTPTVVASGYGYIAQRILDLAFACGVKVRQDSDLAEILAALDLNEEIPPAAFSAVAEILSYIYECNDKFFPQISEQ